MVVAKRVAIAVTIANNVFLFIRQTSFQSDYIELKTLYTNGTENEKPLKHRADQNADGLNRRSILSKNLMPSFVSVKTCHSIVSLIHTAML